VKSCGSGCGGCAGFGAEDKERRAGRAVQWCSGLQCLLLLLRLLLQMFAQLR